MSYSPAPRLTRQSELVLSAREFFKFRDAVDRLDPDIAVANLRSFPSFGATITLQGGSLVVRASALDTSLKETVRNEMMVQFYMQPEAEIDQRLGSIDLNAEFGKTSASLYLDILKDPKTGNMAVLKKMFPNKDLENRIVRGASIIPDPHIDVLSKVAAGILENVSKLLEMDEVVKLRSLFVALELNLHRDGAIVDIAETMTSDIRGAPVGNNTGKILAAISEISDYLRSTQEYQTIEMLVCNRD